MLTIKNNLYPINFHLLSISLLLLQSCQKEDKRLDDYWVNFATVIKSNNDVRFHLDNNKTLIPKKLKDYNGDSGQRVILNYSFLRNDTIKVNSVSNILTGNIKLNGYPEQYFSEPVNIQSVWVSGNYLNMVLEIEYNKTAHSVALLKKSSTTKNELYFSHATNNDPPGAPVLMYLSFSLENLRVSGNESPLQFTVYINSHTGLKEFHLTLK